MAVIPENIAWSSRQKLTSLLFNRISGFLRFLDSRDGGFCELTQTVIQDVPDDTDFPISFQNEEVDRDGGHSALEQISRYRAKTAGRYFVAGVVAFEINPNGYRAAKIMKNNTQALACSIRPAAASLATFVPVGGRIIYLAVDDWVEIYARQTSGTTLKTTATDGGSGMSVVFMGA